MTGNAWFGCFWTAIWKQYCHIWNQLPQICLTAKFGGKTKLPKFGNKNAWFGYFWTKMSYLGIFGTNVWKYYCHIWNQHCQICLVAKLPKKQKYLDLRPEIPGLDIFGLEFGNNLAIFEISTLKFLILQNFRKKQKSLNLRPKMLYLGVFEKNALFG